jgi:hypothetical protein
MVWLLSGVETQEETPIPVITGPKQVVYLDRDMSNYVNGLLALGLKPDYGAVGVRGYGFSTGILGLGRELFRNRTAQRFVEEHKGKDIEIHFVYPGEFEKPLEVSLYSRPARAEIHPALLEKTSGVFSE